MSAVKIGEVLVKQGLCYPEDVTKALDEHRRTGEKLSQILVKTGVVKEESVLKAISADFGLPGIDLSLYEIQKEVIQLVPRELVEKFCFIPVQRVGAQTLVVAFSDPSDMTVRDDLRFITRCKIQPVVATEGGIAAAIDKYYLGKVKEMSAAIDTESPRDTVETDAELSSSVSLDIVDDDSKDGGPIVKFINAVLIDAMRKKVSDIHFEPYEKRYRVRFRIDGVLIEAAQQSNSAAPAISSRIKIMSKLDIAEKRKPQDGRIKIRLGSGKEMDFRVSVLPCIWGEKIVLRLLDKNNLQLDMTKLGMEPDDLEIFKECIYLPQGLLLITGPTGSGKTTTIYSALAELNKADVNISTAEDPVEFNLEGINQVQMHPEVGLTFASALKSFLRQDPDIIMVGEIRDLETGEIAVKAASTGHLVVSTLHTNDAPQTVVRLTEMGIPSYIVTSTVTLIVAQRLVAKICDKCRIPYSVEDKVLINLGIPSEEVKDYNQLAKGKGCAVCNGLGYKGRSAIYEMMKMTEPIKEAILKEVTASELRNLAREQGMRTLRRSALLKLKRGITTIEEVLNSSLKDI